ncbi:MAG: LacI family transcriptional regulator [Bacteroidetes bacterium]|nr:LacI family transcriptional regulator [Bacteroidota bacterium]
MNEPITIKDIARKFKCSPSTVSRALNNHPAINIETRKNISEYATKMGYQKNAVSLSLLNKSTMTIGLVVPSITFSHEQTIIDGIQSVTTDHGFMLNICISNESLVEEQRQIEKLMANRVDAILVSASHGSFEKQEFSHFYKVKNSNIPLVFIDREIPLEDFDSVITDDYQGAYQATQHLLDIGRQNLAFLAGSEFLVVCKNRKKGFEECLKDNNLVARQDWIVQTGFDSQSAVEPTNRLFSGTEIPDGIFCVNDNVAFGVVQTLIKMNIEIPKQTAIIGFDNSPLAGFFNPSISSVDRKSFEVGQKAAQLVFDLIQNQNENPQKIVLTPSLEIRDSSQF